MSFNKSHYIGSRDFYKHTLVIAVPIMIQNGITNFVSMLDNIMVGQIGTNPMSGVSIVNQLLFVYNLMIFGGLAGIGIFTAQFAGKGDEEGIRYTVRLKSLLAVLLTGLAILLFVFAGPQLIGLWLEGDSTAEAASETLAAAKSYLFTMYFGLLPFAASQVYSSTLRENGETVAPMKAGLIAVAVNLVGNYILIYGKFGAPELGVVGAAIATVISRFVEAAYVILYTHRHAARFTFVTGVFSSLRVPRGLCGRILVKAFPLLMNETLWSLGMTALSQQYSTLGLSIVAAFNISNTIGNVFNIAFIAMGESTSIILGQELGAGKMKTVRDDAARLAVFSAFLCIISGALLCTVSGLFPRIYNTTEEVRTIAGGLIILAGIFMPFYGFENSMYFTIRAGGNTWITFFFDCCFVWCVSIPAAFVLTHFTGLSILPVYTLVQLLEFIKCVIGYVLVRRGGWVRDLTEYVS